MSTSENVSSYCKLIQTQYPEIEIRSARLHNPGLEPARVDSVLAASCVLVGLMRRLQLDAVTIEAS